MSTYLYRLGRFAYRRRGWVVVAWLGLLLLSGIGAATLAGEAEDSFELPGTESTDAMALLNERFPDAAPSGASARVVFAAPGGETLADPDNQAVITATVQELATGTEVTSVANPFEVGTLSQDGTIGYAEVEYGASWPTWAEDEIQEAVEPARDAGLTVEIGGDALTEDFEEGGLTSELIGLGVAAMVLIITFGSFVAAGMPLANAIIGVGSTIALIAVATRYFDLGTATPILATMLGLALAIDYSLFIVSRYRHELAKGWNGPDAAGRALGTAGSAIVFAGLTVIVALCGLFVVGIPMLTEMGFAAAFAVAMAVLIALTMLPALCGFAGQRILGGRIPGLRARDPEDPGRNGKRRLSDRWAGLVTRRPILVVVGVGLAMLVLAVPALDLRLGLPDEGTLSEDNTQRRAYDLVAEGFGEGFNGPLLVVLDATGADAEAVGGQVTQAVTQLDNVAMATPPMVNPAADTAMVTVFPHTGPSAVETEDLVTDIRGVTGDLEQATGTSIAVTGMTAIIIDFNQSMTDALLPYIGLIAGLSFVLLMLVFRSVLVPLKAALGFLLTMAATFGAVVAVFQWGWLSDVLAVEQTGMVISFLPIVLIGIVFGLAMDYQVFMVTRMREEYAHGAAPTQAIVTGFKHGSRVVAAAAIIMISVFGAFALSGQEFIMQIALALAVAIALDAFVVRMTLVPAGLALLGRAAWWLPRWLNRALPNVDVEGTKLESNLATSRKEPVAAR